MANKKINVGISVFAIEGANLWSSGINQNIGFLIQLLRRSDKIGRIFLLNGGDLEHLPSGLDFGAPDVPLVAPRDVTYEIDFVIEMGAQLPIEWLRHVHVLGVKIVTFFVGNMFAEMGEFPIFGKEGGYIFNSMPRDEVWTLPQYMGVCAPMLNTITRVSAHAMPHIWAPTFIDRRIRDLGVAGFQFGFDARQMAKIPHAWRVAIFEPNISVVKNCVVPMLICEYAHRQDQDAIELMMVVNSFHMKEHLTFNRFATHLDITRCGRATYEPRLDFVDCMARCHMNAVVSHHWENGQNYLYYDALYGRYPLVHNSTWLQQANVGFYYPGFDAQAGGELLLDAIVCDVDFWDDYAVNAERFLSTVSPERDENVATFVDRITELVEAKAVR